jgi:hypothetical protein
MDRGIPARDKRRRLRGLLLAVVLLWGGLCMLGKVAIGHYAPDSFPLLYVAGLLTAVTALVAVDRVAVIARRERRHPRTRRARRQARQVAL